MPDLKITIGGKNFFVSCESGQEEDLKKASLLLNNEIDKLKGDIPKTSDDNLLLMAGLIMSDKLMMKEKDLGKIKENMNKVEEELSLVKDELNVFRQKNVKFYDYEKKLEKISEFLDTILESKLIKEKIENNGDTDNDYEITGKQSSLF